MVALEYASNFSGLLDILISAGVAGGLFFAVRKGFIGAARGEAIRVEKRVYDKDNPDSLDNKVGRIHGRLQTHDRLLRKVLVNISYIKGKMGLRIAELDEDETELEGGIRD